VGEHEVLGCETLFLCVSISSFEEVLQRIGPLLPIGSTVMDTCSVKKHPAEVMEREIPRGVASIASHPMFGPDSAVGGVEGLPMVMHPLGESRESFERWRENFRAFGINVLEMTPEEHDRGAAYTQGITHFLGRMLQQLDLQPSAMGTRGYEKLLDLVQQTCNDPYQLFLDLQRYNPYTEEMRKALLGALHRTIDGLEDEGE